MFQIRNTDTNDIVNVYQIEHIFDSQGNFMIRAIVYSKDMGWDSIELDDEWEPLDVPNNNDQPKKKNPYHTPFGVGGIGDIDVGNSYDRGFIPPDNKLSI